MSLDEPYTWRQVGKFVSIICLTLVVLFFPVFISWRIYQYQAVRELVQAVEARNSEAVIPALEQVKSRDATGMALPRLLELMDSDRKVAFSAALSRAMNGMGPEVVSKLLERTKPSENADTRCRAIYILTTIKHGRLNAYDVDHIIQALIQALSDKNQYVRLSASQAIAHFDPSRAEEVLPLIVGLLKDPLADIRLHTVDIIGLYGNRAEIVLPELLLALKDPVLINRIFAARVIGEIGSPDQSVIEALTEMLSDQDFSCQSEAADSLGQLGPVAAAAVPALLALLASLQNVGPVEINEEEEQQKGEHVRISVIDALGEIGHASPEVIQALIDELNDQRMVYSRVCAARSLGKLGSEAVNAVPHLVKVMQESEINAQSRSDDEMEMGFDNRLSLEAEIALESIDPQKFNRALREPGGKEGEFSN